MPVPRFQAFCRQSLWAEHSMPGVIDIPIRGGNSSFGLDTFMKSRPWIGGENMEGGSLDPLLDRPFDRSVENIFIVFIHAKDKTSVHHHAQVVQPSDASGIIPI